MIQMLESCRFGGLLAEMPRPVWAPLLAAKGSMLPMLILLLGGHALCDYPLQGQFLSDAKNHRRPIPSEHWMRALFAHSMIHCAMVLLVTGSVYLAIAELIIHAFTDYAKCDGRIDSTRDQAIHYGCKIAWAILAAR